MLLAWLVSRSRLDIYEAPTAFANTDESEQTRKIEPGHRENVKAIARRFSYPGGSAALDRFLRNFRRFVKDSPSGRVPRSD